MVKKSASSKKLAQLPTNKELKAAAKRNKVIPKNKLNNKTHLAGKLQV